MRLAALERGLSVCPALRPMEKSHEPRAATCPVRAKQEALVTPPTHQGPPCDPVGEHADQPGGSSEFMSRRDRSLVLKAPFTDSGRSSGRIEAATWEE